MSELKLCDTGVLCVMPEPSAHPRFPRALDYVGVVRRAPDQSLHDDEASILYNDLALATYDPLTLLLLA